MRNIIIYSYDRSLTSLSSLLSKLKEIETEKSFKNVEIIFSQNSFLTPPHIALLTSWALSQKENSGYSFILSGDEEKIRYLDRMGFHDILNIPRAGIRRHAEAGRFVPIQLIRDPHHQHSAVDALCELVIKQFENADKFLPEFEWAVNEITDNILTHAQSPIPGVLVAQFYPREKQIEFAVADRGRGLRRSLSESNPGLDSRRAIELALERGVTRNTDIGQGNGLAGTRLIIARNKGDMLIWSEKHRLQERIGIRNVIEEPELQGVLFSAKLYIDRPIDLSDTWLQKPSWSYLDRVISEVADGKVINIRDECESVGSRDPARRLRNKITNIIKVMEDRKETIQITISLEGMNRCPSSSFLDELFGKLICELGTSKFKQYIYVHKMSDITKKRARAVMQDRLRNCK